MAVFATGVSFGQTNVPWSDGLEDYNLVDGLSTQSDFETWDENLLVDALVVDDHFHTGLQSVRIAEPNGPFTDTDLLMRFPDHQFKGCYEFTAWWYVPKGHGGGPDGETYFILQSAYTHLLHDPPDTVWAVQVHVNAANKTVIADFEPPGSRRLVPKLDEWVEIKVWVNFDEDLHQIYYDGQAMFLDVNGDPYPILWSTAMNGGNLPQIASMDLYANLTSATYFDDLDLQGIRCSEIGCMYKQKKNSKAKKGCTKCYMKGDIIATGQTCAKVKDCTPKKLKEKKYDCLEGEIGFCKKLKAKRDECVLP